MIYARPIVELLYHQRSCSQIVGLSEVSTLRNSFQFILYSHRCHQPCQSKQVANIGPRPWSLKLVTLVFECRLQLVYVQRLARSTTRACSLVWIFLSMGRSWHHVFILASVLSACRPGSGLCLNLWLMKVSYNPLYYLNNLI